MGGGGGWGGEDAIVAIVAWTSSSALFTERRGEASRGEFATAISSSGKL